VLTVLGIPNLATGLLGGVNGDYIKNQLDQERISHDFTRISSNNRMSLTIIDSSTKALTRILERGPKISKTELKAFTLNSERLLSKASCLVLSGRNAYGVADSFYGEIISRANRLGVFTVFDTSGKPYPIGLKKKPLMVKPNLKEAEEIVGRKLTLFFQIKKALDHFHNLGISTVAITMGSRGAIVSNQRQIFMATPPPINRKSPVGCGDSFIAGFVASMNNRDSFENSIRLAVACGTANAFTINPGDVKLQLIKKIYNKVKIRKLKKLSNG